MKELEEELEEEERLFEEIVQLDDDEIFEAAIDFINSKLWDIDSTILSGGIVESKIKKLEHILELVEQLVEAMVVIHMDKHKRLELFHLYSKFIKKCSKAIYALKIIEMGY